MCFIDMHKAKPKCVIDAKKVGSGKDMILKIEALIKDSIFRANATEVEANV